MHALLYELIERNNCRANNNIQKSILVLENDLTYAGEVIEGMIDKYLNVFLYEQKNNIHV